MFLGEKSSPRARLKSIRTIHTYIQCIQLREQINGIFYCLSLFFTGGEIWELQILFFVYLYINAILTHDMFYNCGSVVNVEVILVMCLSTMASEA